MRRVKGRRKGREGLHPVVLMLYRVERKEEDGMVAAEAKEAKGNTWEFFFLCEMKKNSENKRRIKAETGE